MLSTDANERLTRVGPGTPMGELMRRYWHPVAATVELDPSQGGKPTKPVRLLGEDLVLYRDRAGTIGLIERLCAHRRVDLSYGIPEEHGLRCMYHGWLYNEVGPVHRATLRGDGASRRPFQGEGPCCSLPR